MVLIEFYLTDDDMDRLWAIKRRQGKNDLTGNEFARDLLEKELQRLHPDIVKYTDDLKI